MSPELGTRIANLEADGHLIRISDKVYAPRKMRTCAACYRNLYTEHLGGPDEPLERTGHTCAMYPGDDAA